MKPLYWLSIFFLIYYGLNITPVNAVSIFESEDCLTSDINNVLLIILRTRRAVFEITQHVFSLIPRRGDCFTLTIYIPYTRRYFRVTDSASLDFALAQFMETSDKVQTTNTVQLFDELYYNPPSPFDNGTKTLIFYNFNIGEVLDLPHTQHLKRLSQDKNWNVVLDCVSYICPKEDWVKPNQVLFFENENTLTNTDYQMLNLLRNSGTAI